MSKQCVIWTERRAFSAWLQLFSNEPLRMIGRNGKPPADAFGIVGSTPSSIDHWRDLSELANHLVALASGTDVDSPPITVLVNTGTDRLAASHNRVLRALDDAGFAAREVVMDELSPIELVAIMQRTRLLIGHYGPGLSNAIFMRPGSSIIEFRSTCLFSARYKKLAAAFHHNWAAIELAATPEPFVHGIAPQDCCSGATSSDLPVFGGKILPEVLQTFRAAGISG